MSSIQATSSNFQEVQPSGNIESSSKLVDSKIIRIAEVIFVDHPIKIGFVIGAVCIGIALAVQFPLIPVISVIAGGILLGIFIRHLLKSDQEEVKSLLPKISHNIDEIQTTLTNVPDSEELLIFGNYTETVNEYLSQKEIYSTQMKETKDKLEHAKPEEIRTVRRDCLSVLRDLQSKTEILKLQSNLFLLSCRKHKLFFESNESLFKEKEAELEGAKQALASLKHDSQCQTCQQFYDPSCKTCLEAQKFKNEINRCEGLLNNFEDLLKSIQYANKPCHLYATQDELLEDCALWSHDLEELSKKIDSLHTLCHLTINDFTSEFYDEWTQLEALARLISCVDEIAPDDSYPVEQIHEKYEALKKISTDQSVKPLVNPSDPLVIHRALSLSKERIKQIKQFEQATQKVFFSMLEKVRVSMLKECDSLKRKEFESQFEELCNSMLKECDSLKLKGDESKFEELRKSKQFERQLTQLHSSIVKEHNAELEKLFDESKSALYTRNLF